MLIFKMLFYIIYINNFCYCVKLCFSISMLKKLIDYNRNFSAKLTSRIAVWLEEHEVDQRSKFPTEPNLS